MHLVCHDTSGGCGIGAGNETGAEHGEGVIEAGTLDVIFGVGATKAADCLGTGGAGHCGGWSRVGWGTAAGEAEAIDGALDVVPRGWSDV